MLPIEEYESEIVDAVTNNQVTVVVGQTGSGKTTKLPVFLLQAGLAQDKMIGVTQPRRIAATSVARFVQEQVGDERNKVGYQIRFDHQVSNQTVLKFMTDGILLREIQLDPLLKRYSLIMIDEAHERSENIDFLLGLLKGLIAKRPDLKLIISSATINAEKFADYFGGAVVVEVPGRTYPVDTIWKGSNIQEWTGINEVAHEVAETVAEIHASGEKGDILIFTPGLDYITACCKSIERLELSNLVILPAHGGLASEDQEKIFHRFPQRKVIVATNIAETSITIDGVTAVIDTGLIKQVNFHPNSGIQSLDVVAHSQAGCEQRAGRAGRTKPGVCYRLYSPELFADRPDYTKPEILRKSLANVVLTMESLRIEDIPNFDFIDQPDRQVFQEAYDTLEMLGAIVKDQAGLTPIGEKMADLPLEPRIAKMILSAEEYGCVKDVATVAAFLSAPNVFIRPRDKENEADQEHRKFKDESSDCLTYLKIWRAYEESGFNRQWCIGNFLRAKTLWEIKQIREQLFDTLRQNNIYLSESSDHQRIVKAVVSGLVYNLLEHYSRHAYRPVTATQILEDIYIHPGSSLFGWSAYRWIVCTEMMTTTKCYARGCSEVDPVWLPEMLPKLFFFGEHSLHSYDAATKKATAIRPVIKTQSGFFQNVVVAQAVVDIDLELAWELQQVKIREAQEKGYRICQVEKGKIGSSRFVKDMVSGQRYMLLGSSMFGEVTGDEIYYCNIDEFSDFARVEFKILAIPKPAHEIERTKKPVVSSNVLERLQSSLGRRTQ